MTMRRTKTIQVGEPPRDVIIREPTVGEIRNWLVELEKLKSNSNPIDFVTHGLFNDASLTDIVLMTDLSLENLDTMAPSEIRVVIEACQEINPDFFTVRRRRMLMWEMESHSAYAALLNSEQWMLANPGPEQTISPP
ncbi:MAG: hypothetical protein HQM03_14950 [Magnetococcales bacterium]|nr:hypothetical protein [Magnetococcales bacterium]